MTSIIPASGSGKWETQVGTHHWLKPNSEWMSSREEDGERERKSGEVRS